MINERLPSCSGNHDEGKCSESWQAKAGTLAQSMAIELPSRARQSQE